MKKRLLLSLLAAVSTVQAASFDFIKATAADEKAICANRVLNDKDVEMATQYRFLKGLFAMGGRGAMQDRQQVWLKQRKSCKSDSTCLNKRYDERIRELNTIYERINKPL
ncbi:hypothetical protein GWD52_09560 [Enterobacteriaceae bacterium 4M9]|nr:hypothetical protein [Enterobacteriaceae bacterium 4M9]